MQSKYCVKVKYSQANKNTLGLCVQVCDDLSDGAAYRCPHRLRVNRNPSIHIVVTDADRNVCGLLCPVIVGAAQARGYRGDLQTSGGVVAQLET